MFSFFNFLQLSSPSHLGGVSKQLGDNCWLRLNLDSTVTYKKFISLN